METALSLSLSYSLSLSFSLSLSLSPTFNFISRTFFSDNQDEKAQMVLTRRQTRFPHRHGGEGSPSHWSTTPEELLLLHRIYLSRRPADLVLGRVGFGQDSRSKDTVI